MNDKWLERFIYNHKLVKVIIYYAISVSIAMGFFYVICPDIHVSVKEMRYMLLAIIGVELLAIFTNSGLLYKRQVSICVIFLSIFLLLYNHIYNSNSNLLSFKTYTFFIAISGLLVMLDVLGKRYIIAKLLGNVIASLLLFIVAVYFGYYSIYKTWFGHDALLAIMQTNYNEVLEYVVTYFNISIIIIVIVVVLAVLMWRKSTSHIEICKNLKETKKIIILLLGTIILTALSSKCGKNLVTEPFVKANSTLKNYKDFEQQVIERKKYTSSLKINNNGDSGVYVLVIGESQNREHMHAYGYKRNNTPWLSKMRRDSNFLFFENAYSCHTHTVPVLTYAMTFKNQYNDIELSKAVSLLEMSEAAGYDTVWISNQVRYGAWDNPVTVIASEANQQKWYNSNMGETLLTNFYDLRLVEGLADINMSNRMLIVFHLMGNHESYDQRYPIEFEEYGSKSDVDTYDNSILYNDYVVANIFDKARKLPNFKGFIYFADHADAVEQGLGHNCGSYVPEMTYIPMYMYFSDSYIADHKELYSQLLKSQKLYFTNDLIYNCMLSIMDIKDSAYNEPCNDIAGPHYNSDKSRFKTLYGIKELNKI